MGCVSVAELLKYHYPSQFSVVLAAKTGFTIVESEKSNFCHENLGVK